MTLAEMVDRVLQKLGVQATGETSAPEDVQLVRSKYAGLYDELQTLSLVDWSDDDDIPPFAEESIIQMVAARCVTEFEIEEPKRSAVLAEGLLYSNPPSFAEKTLRKQMASVFIPEPASPDYF